MMATPTTLIALLRTASFGWREERLAENAQRISDEGRRLHERIATVMEHFADLGTLAQQSVKHFNKSLRLVRAARGRVGAAARRAGRAREEGARSRSRRSTSRAVGPQLPDKPERRAAPAEPAAAADARAARRSDGKWQVAAGQRG